MKTENLVSLHSRPGSTPRNSRRRYFVYTVAVLGGTAVAALLMAELP